MNSVELDFDHHSDDCNADPIAYYRSFRQTCPVGWSDNHGGYWYTTRWSDVVEIARNDELYSVERHSGNGVDFVIPSGGGLDQYPLELDPPRSVPFRELINPLLTPEAVEQLVPMIQAETTACIDAFIENGTCDLVKDLANPLPTAVTLNWLGFPKSDRAKLAGPVHDIFAAPLGSERAMRGIEGLNYLERRIRELLIDRRRTPQDDVLTYLVQAQHPDDRSFTDDEVVSVVYLLVAGGVDTTTSLTGSTLVWLSQNPAARSRLINDPGLLATATEEFLRVFAPSQSMARTVTADTAVGGCPVRSGERVLIPWVAANHDPEVFADPESIVLDRNPKQHLSFGIGSHRCAGAHLARAMFTEMISQVLERLPDFVIDQDRAVKYPTLGNQAGYDAAPAVFTAGTRSLLGHRVRVAGTRKLTPDVLELRLASADHRPLPGWEAGAHVALVLGSGRIRQYSLCGDRDDLGEYTVAVLREENGRGGSAEIHEYVREGEEFEIRGPRNQFPIEPADEYLLIAGGIGITPVLAMLRTLRTRNVATRVIYGGRSRGSMAYLRDVQDLAGDDATIVPFDELGLPDIAGALATLGPGGAVYCCGPVAMIEAVRRECARAGIEDRLHVERFSTTVSGGRIDTSGSSFEVRLARTAASIQVPAEVSLLDALTDVVPGLARDCEEGYCGACETRVLGGRPIHRDSVLTESERSSNRSMMVCVGRAEAGEPLILDL